MAFTDDIKPLLTFFRFIALWTEVVVFSLALLSVLGFIPFVVFGVILIFNLAVLITQHKARKAARILGQDYVPTPKTWVIVLDFLTGVAALVIWIVHMWAVTDFEISVFDAYVLVGELVILHMHVFFASTQVHVQRQRKNGVAAARRAEQKDRSNVQIELTTTNDRREAV